MNRDSEYLNVDLDIAARHDLQPLVDAFGKRAFALHVTRIRGRYLAALELTPSTTTADRTIRRLAALVESLPPDARRLWDTAQVRDFNIGIQAGRNPHAFYCVISAEALLAITAVGGRLVFTVYGSDVGAKETARRKRRAKSTSAREAHG